MDGAREAPRCGRIFALRCSQLLAVFCLLLSAFRLLEVYCVVDVDNRAGRGAGGAAQAKGAGQVIGRVIGHAPERGLPP